MQKSYIYRDERVMQMSWCNLLPNALTFIGAPLFAEKIYWTKKVEDDLKVNTDGTKSQPIESPTSGVKPQRQRVSLPVP